MTQKEALAILKQGHNAFITGAAGSGKTHLLNEYVKYLTERGVEVGITASTGIAATHLGGMTIHAWSGLGIRDRLSQRDLDDLEERSYLWKRLERTQVLIIDEVSMLHHFRLDLINQIAQAFKRSDLPFGGLQVILCGDFFQLPPVSRFGEAPAAFAYQAESWSDLDLKICYLEEQHRQTDSTYLSILNAIRANQVPTDLLKQLQSRLGQATHIAEPTKLYSHNVNVDAENDRELSKLSGQVYEYEMVGRGNDKLVETLKKGCLAPALLRLKKGARVMFVKNNYDAGYANGTLGEVYDCSDDSVTVRTAKGRLIKAELSSWRVEEEGKTKAEISQLPLRLAWAITVHKSQGLSLDAAEIDLSQSFEKGMGYVALSRVRSLAGLSLIGLNNLALRVNEEVLEQDQVFQQLSKQQALDNKKLAAVAREKNEKAFLLKIGAVEPGLARPAKLSTVEKTKLLVLEEANLKDMAKARGLSVGTILDHLEKIKAADPNLKLTYLAQDLSAAKQKKIKEALIKGGTVAGYYPLGPAKNRLGLTVSYDDIRLVRLLM